MNKGQHEILFIRKRSIFFRQQEMRYLELQTKKSFGYDDCNHIF